ncbi:cytochrome P450 [Nitrospira sp. BLG_2]|uniref:cytochrome P450 n=1 Tax=Nitrospira sp. BLG_2 TaxID=3397507 RepID=UPI003B98F673
MKLPMGLVVDLLLGQRDAAMYVLNHPADIKHVLVTNQDNYRKAPVPPVESRIFGQGVLHTEGEIHHRRRRLFLPFFHGNHAAAYTDLITGKACDLVGHWQHGTTVDIEHEMAHLTLSVIWRLLFGRDVDSEADTIREAIAVGQSLIKLQYDSLLASCTPLWVPTKLHRRFTRGHRSMEAMIRRMIEERRTASHQSDDVLALLLAARNADGRPLSDKEIRDEIVTFLLAGHETTANALTWTWFLLAQFRPVQERLACELNQVLGGRCPTAADVPRLRYTKMVWEESLRLYPPAWSLHTRVAHAQDRLPSGAVLPSRAWVFISPWSLHRNARWFPDPNRFDPERFSDEAKPTHTPYSYLPFGAGGRRCLGESFAELEGLLILATVASRFQLRLVDGQTIQPEPVMTLRPNVPVRMVVQRIDREEPHPAVV